MRLAAALAAAAAAAFDNGPPLLAIEDIPSPTLPATFPADGQPPEFQSLPPLEEVIGAPGMPAGMPAGEPGATGLLTPPMIHEFVMDISNGEGVVVKNVGVPAGMSELPEFEFPPQEGGVEPGFVMEMEVPAGMSEFPEFEFPPQEVGVEPGFVMEMEVPAGMSEFPEFEFAPQGGVEPGFIMDMEVPAGMSEFPEFEFSPQGGVEPGFVMEMEVPAGMSEFPEFEFPPQEGGVEPGFVMGELVVDMSDSEGEFFVDVSDSEDVVVTNLRGDVFDQSGGPPHRGHHDDHHGGVRPHSRAAKSHRRRVVHHCLAMIALGALIAGCVYRCLRARRAAARQGRLENEVAQLQGQVRVLSAVVVSHQPAMTHVALLPSAAEAGATGATAYVPLPAAGACVATPVRATAIAQAAPGVVSAADGNSRPLSVPLID